MNPLHAMLDRDGFGVALTSMGLTGTGVEVGVFKGDYSYRLLSTWTGNLIGIDCYNNGTEFDILYDAIRNNEIYVRNGRYTIFVCDSRTGANYTPSELDFVFIDAGHTYEEVMEDILSWYPKIKRGGVLSGHDYQAQTPGVAKAVDFFTAAYDLELITKPCGSWFAIKK